MYAHLQEGARSATNLALFLLVMLIREADFVTGDEFSHLRMKGLDTFDSNLQHSAILKVQIHRNQFCYLSLWQGVDAANGEKRSPLTQGTKLKRHDQENYACQQIICVAKT